MPEGSTRLLIALGAIILVFSFKDLLISNTAVEQKEDEAKPIFQEKPAINDLNNDDDALNSLNFDDDAPVQEDNEPIQKEIPRLKINNNNNQQLKFLFW